MRPWNQTIVIVRSILLAIVLMTTPIPAAEKQTGDTSVALPEIVFPGHANIGADLNAYKQPNGTWEIADVRADRYDRLYFPGDPIRLRITLRNASAKPQTLAGTWRWAWISDRPSDDRGGIAYQYADESASDLDSSDVPAGGEVVVEVNRVAPQRYGTLGLFLAAGEPQARWAGNIAVVHRLAPGPMPDSMFMADARALRVWQRDLEVPVLERLGVRWVRFNVDMKVVMPQPKKWDFTELDAMVDQHRRSGMLSVFMGGFAPDWTRPHGRLSWPRGNPHKQDGTPAPKFYDDWAEYFRQVVARHKDNIRAVNVWNEPYEGGGISDWGGTGEHLRGLMRAMYRGAKAADPTVLAGGADSDGNVADNLMTDPKWQTYVDLLTVHGFGPAGQFIHLHRPPGVQIWNTETWYTSRSDQIVQWQLLERARGLEKVNVLILGNVFTSGYRSGGRYDPKDRNNVPDLIPHPAAVSYNAMAYQLEGMQFVGEATQGHLPYAMLFKRTRETTAGHRAMLVLFGSATSPADMEWPDVRSGAGEAVVRQMPTGVKGVADHYGNAIEPAADGTWRLPFDTRPVYIAADDVESLREVVQRIEVVSFERPIQVGLIDPTAAKLDGAEMRLRLTNPLPRSQRVRATVEAEGWRFESSAVETELAAGETRDLPVRIAHAGAMRNGRASVKVRVETPTGAFVHDDVIEHRVIHRLTPTLDASFEEWTRAGITPVVLTQSIGVNAALAAAMPWEELTAADSTAGRYAMAYDDAHLYLMAEIRTPKRGERPWDQTRDDWYELHPGGYAYKVAPRWPFTGESVQLAIQPSARPTTQPTRHAQQATDYLFGFYETQQGTPQAWLFRGPGVALPLHRYPFSPVQPNANRLLSEPRVTVKYDEAALTTRYEIALPWASLPEIKVESGALISGLELKLTTSRWSGLFSAAGRGAAKMDLSIFQPHWATGFTASIPWRLE